MFFLPSTILLLIINFEWGFRKVYAGNTVCTSNHTDWYTSVIGETPCTTYERLRQICNSAYQVGTLTRNTPPDHCDDQVQDCCCNSISFALSMLCLACQDDTADGFDAGVGAYQQYLLKDGNNTCGPRKDRNFTTTIQNAVCNSDIKIEDQLYNLFWVDGQWFYAYTRDTIIRDHAAFSNKTQTKCSTTTSSALSTNTPGLSTDPNSTPTSKTSSGSGPGSTSSNSQLSPGSIAGIVVGVVVIIALVIVIVFLILRRRHVYAAASRQEVDPYTTHGPRTFSTDYNSSGITSTGYLSDGDEPRAPAVLAAPASLPKRNRQRNSRTPISNTNTSTSGSRSGHTQGSSMTVGLETSERHVDAGPVLGTNLGRSNSGRLPPAYGEQLNPVGPTNQTAQVRPPVHMSYTPPEDRYAQFESDYAFPPPQEPRVQDGSDDSSMREVGNPQSRINPLVPVRRKD